MGGRLKKETCHRPFPTVDQVQGEEVSRSRLHGGCYWPVARRLQHTHRFLGKRPTPSYQAELKRKCKTDEPYLMLNGMLVEEHKRWEARSCLGFGFEERLFTRRPADNLIVCPDDDKSLVSAVPGGRSGATPARGPVRQNQHGNPPPRNPPYPGRIIRATR